MLHTANFVFDSKQDLAALRIDDVLESILVLVALLGDQSLRRQPAMRAGEVVDVDLNVMPIVGRRRLVGFTEEQVLPRPGSHAGKRSTRVLEPCCLRTHDLRIKARDTLSRSHRHIELHVWDTDRHRAEALGWSIAMNPVAPWAGRLDVALTFMECEASPAEYFTYPAQAPRQCVVIGDHYPDMAPQYLGLAGGEMELLPARVHPHVGGTGHHIRVPRQPQPVNVEDRGLPLVRNRHVNVLQGNDIAEILGASIVGFFLHQLGHAVRCVKNRVSGHSEESGWSL